MGHPPPGYDDHSVVPQQRLKNLLGNFEKELHVIQNVFQERVTGTFHLPERVERDFWMLRASAEEIGPQYAFLVEKLIADYAQFSQSPDQGRLNKIFADVKNLQLLLVG